MSFKLAKHIRLYSIIDYTWKLYQSSYILRHWDSSAEPGPNLLSWMYPNRSELRNQKRKLLAPGCPPCRRLWPWRGLVLPAPSLGRRTWRRKSKFRKLENRIMKGAYLNVLRVCSQDDMQGLIIAIMQVLAFSPMKESLRTCVSLLALKGRWAPLRPNARIHSFKANSDLFISAPSILVCLLAEFVSAPRSFPAKSIRENFPCKGLLLVFTLKTIWKTAWLLDEFAFALVWPDMRRLLPLVITRMVITSISLAFVSFFVTQGSFLMHFLCFKYIFVLVSLVEQQTK